MKCALGFGITGSDKEHSETFRGFAQNPMSFGDFYLDLAKKLRREIKVRLPLCLYSLLEKKFCEWLKEEKKEGKNPNHRKYLQTALIYPEVRMFHFLLCPSEIKAILLLGQERWSPTQTRKILQDIQNRERESKLEPDFAKQCLTHLCEPCLVQSLWWSLFRNSS